MPRLRARHARPPRAFRSEARTDVALIVQATPRVTAVVRHKQNLLTLLSAVDVATTVELAHCVELGRARAHVLLDELWCEGRIEKAGRGAWRLP